MGCGHQLSQNPKLLQGFHRNVLLIPVFCHRTSRGKFLLIGVHNLLRLRVFFRFRFHMNLHQSNIIEKFVVLVTKSRNWISWFGKDPSRSLITPPVCLGIKDAMQYPRFEDGDAINKLVFDSNHNTFFWQLGAFVPFEYISRGPARIRTATGSLPPALLRLQGFLRGRRHASKISCDAVVELKSDPLAIADRLPGGGSNPHWSTDASDQYDLTLRPAERQRTRTKKSNASKISSRS